MDIRDTKEEIKAVAVILNTFLKSGPNSPSRLEGIKTQILDIALSLATSPEEATENYKGVCKDLLDKVIKVRGMPTRAIVSVGGAVGEKNQSDLVSSSGSHIAQIFDNLLPKIISRYNWCIENYKRQSKLYFDEQLSQFHDLLVEFLGQVPIGGTKDKLIESKIAKIERELQSLTKWNQSFYIAKANSFFTEIEFIFSLESGAIAAMWRSHWRQMGYDYREEHKQRDGKIYAIRGNWALEKGLMKVGPQGYIDDVTKPGEEEGCRCFYRFIYTLRDLPKDMLTTKGLETLL